MSDRDCNNCVYSARNGGCRKGICNGTKTVKDIQEESKTKTIDEIVEMINRHQKECDALGIIATAEWVKMSLLE